MLEVAKSGLERLKITKYIFENLTLEFYQLKKQEKNTSAT
jgi:hypothetical protein